MEEFEKVRVLGVGGTGIVYELLHKSNGKRYAMKEMEIKNKLQMQMAVSEAEMLKDIMEQITHPNIMTIEKVFQVRTALSLPNICHGSHACCAVGWVKVLPGISLVHRRRALRAYC